MGCAWFTEYGCAECVGVPGVGVLVGDVLSPGVLSVDVLCVRFSGAFEITFE